MIDLAFTNRRFVTSDLLANFVRRARSAALAIARQLRPLD